MKIFRPLWEDGAALAPQQFQQQARWNAHIADTVARMGISHPWGVVNAEFDTAALALSRLNATRLVVRFQDGTIVDTELADNLPPVCDLSAAMSVTTLPYTTILLTYRQNLNSRPSSVCALMVHCWMTWHYRRSLHLLSKKSSRGRRLFASTVCRYSIPANRC